MIIIERGPNGRAARTGGRGGRRPRPRSRAAVLRRRPARAGPAPRRRVPAATRGWRGSRATTPGKPRRRRRALALLVDELSGPERRCPGADDDELAGLLQAWAAIESWASAAKLGVIREMMRRDGPPSPGSDHGDLPETWSASLRYELAGRAGLLHPVRGERRVAGVGAAGPAARHRRPAARTGR